MKYKSIQIWNREKFWQSQRKNGSKFIDESGFAIFFDSSERFAVQQMEKRGNLQKSNYTTCVPLPASSLSFNVRHRDSLLSRLWIDSGIKEDTRREDIGGPTWFKTTVYVYASTYLFRVQRVREKTSFDTFTYVYLYRRIDGSIDGQIDIIRWIKIINIWRNISEQVKYLILINQKR